MWKILPVFWIKNVKDIASFLELKCERYSQFSGLKMWKILPVFWIKNVEDIASFLDLKCGRYCQFSR